MSSGEVSRTESEQSTQVDIPEFLRPFLGQTTSTASSALQGLQQLSGGDLVAGFTPDQLQAFELARERAGGEGGFIPTAQQTFLDAARGQNIEDFLPQSALDTFASTGSLGFIPQSSRDVLDRTAAGGILPNIATDEFGRAISGDVIPSESTDALSSTARGDFLFGGQGFDAAVEAAVRAARPQVISTFGRAGAGGATGGLAQTAIGESAVDAFARQFGQERGRQLGAADSLARLGLAGQGQRLDAADTLSRLGLAENQQGLASANILGGLANTERSRELSAANLLAALGDTERSRQLTAAGQLPGLALAESDILGQIGAQQQALDQARISAPIDAQLRLLMAALGGLPISSLLGESSQGESKGLSLSHTSDL